MYWALVMVMVMGQADKNLKKFYFTKSRNNVQELFDFFSELKSVFVLHLLIQGCLPAPFAASRLPSSHLQGPGASSERGTRSFYHTRLLDLT